MATHTVQMVTVDRVGGATVPVEVLCPLSAQTLVAAASKKFRSVTKQSRVYHGITGQEIQAEVLAADLAGGAFVVFAGKAGWKGAAALVARHTAAAEEAKEAQSDEPAAAADEQASEEAGAVESSALLAAAQSTRSQGVVLCWKDTQDNGYLSNWASSPIAIANMSYNCVEQWIMASKARACKDEATLSQILAARSPRKQKALGRSLDSKMVKRHWTYEAKWKAQLLGARAKFRQNETLAVKLLATGTKRIAEASPSDRIFGIGLAPNDPLAQDPANWRGSNLLGEALMQVRDELRQHVLQRSGALAFDDDSTTYVPAPCMFLEEADCDGRDEGSEDGDDLHVRQPAELPHFDS